MKKLLLIALLGGACAYGASTTDSLSLFDKKTYQLKNMKMVLNWCLRAGFQGGKMYLGTWLFCKPSTPVLVPARAGGMVQMMPRYKTLPKMGFRFGGAILFLHGLKGFLKECGYGTPAEFIRYLEKGE